MNPSSRKDGKTIKSTIQKCKGSPDLQSYGERAAMFLFSRIGNSRKGREFLSHLGSDKSINDIVHCSTDSLDKWQAEFKKLGSETKYTGKVRVPFESPLPSPAFPAFQTPLLSFIWETAHRAFLDCLRPPSGLSEMLLVIGVTGQARDTFELLVVYLY